MCTNKLAHSEHWFSSYTTLSFSLSIQCLLAPRNDLARWTGLCRLGKAGARLQLAAPAARFFLDRALALVWREQVSSWNKLAPGYQVLVFVDSSQKQELGRGTGR